MNYSKNIFDKIIKYLLLKNILPDIKTTVKVQKQQRVIF